MFGTRFDPSAVVSDAETAPRGPVSLKRRMSEASIAQGDGESDSSDSESSKDGENSSSGSDDNDSDNDSDSSDSDSSELDSDSNSSSDPESSASGTESDPDAMEIDHDINHVQVESEKVNESEKLDESEEVQEEARENDPEYISKHQGIFKKFNKGVTTKTELEHDELEHELVEEMDLKPLPQPELPRDKRLVATSAHINNLNWLAEPIFSSPSNTKPFSEFNLSPFMKKNLANQNFTNAFSVQIEVMNLLLEDIKQHKLKPDMRGDLLVNAATGSGKTLAYSIPIIEDLSTRIVPRVRAIVLVPTKPLINQVKSSLSALAKGTTLSIVSLKSDISIKEEGTKLLANVPDIIVATPGRLVEHLTNGSISLTSLKYLVIDEADRLLNQSFQNWCKILISKLELTSSVDVSQQWTLTTKKLIFSATLTTDAGKLAALKFQEPRLVIVNDQKQLVNEIFTVPATLTEFKLQFGTSKDSIKPLILVKFLITHKKLSNVLIFAKSNEASMRLARLLNLLLAELSPEGFVVEYINSTNNTTSVRSKILKEFSTQKVHIVVATDLIARGIDIFSISDIINYDLPNSSREYVHRVGRTARANQGGNAYNFCFGKGETKWFRTIMKEVARPHDMVELGFDSPISKEDEQVYEKCLGRLQKEVFVQ